jgi:lysophospholipase L1-like esterase
MALGKRFISSIPLLPAAGAVFLLSQVLRAAHRSDLPSFPNQDVSGEFGDPGLPELKVVAVGDSSLTAPGVEELDNVWIRRVVSAFTDRHHVRLLSLAVGGSKATDVIEGQLPTAVEAGADIAIVSVGSNDALRAVGLERYSQDLDHIVTELEGAAGAVVVLGMGDLGSIPRLPRSLRPFLTRRSKAFNAAAKEVALRHPRAVKVYTGGRIWHAFWEDRTLFAGDLFHASDDGHGVFAAEAMPAFEAAYAMAVRSTAG